MNKNIPLSVPNIQGNEKKYVNEALDQEWVSSGGPHIEKFEKQFRDFLNIESSCACQSGTAGLHLCLVAMGIEQDDIVLVPTLTFIATINAVMYQKAIPVFFDCDESLGINTDDLRTYLETECNHHNGETVEKSSNRRVKAIIPVHVFGNTCKMEEIMSLAKEYNLKVIEDATESLGTFYTKGIYRGKYTGTIADAGVFSFNGNKIITTGGGGMVVSTDINLISKIKYLSTQAKDDIVYFIHNEVGYNYRLTNIQAALGIGQMERLEEFIDIKTRNYELYRKLLKDNTLGYMLKFNDDLRPNYWFYSFVLNSPSVLVRDKLIKYLYNKGIQTRPIWKLNHTQKPFQKFKMINGDTAEKYYNSLINIPCSTNLTENDVKYVSNTILSFIKEHS